VLSVIVSNYNGEKTIGKCLERIFSSNYKNYEVIVVDDCSTDDSVKIIKKFPCKLIKLKKELGPSSTRNAGARKAKGNILVLVDADVLIKRNSLNLILQSFKKHDVAAVMGMYSKNCIYENISSVYKNLNKHFFFKKLPDYVSLGSTSLLAIKKSVFNEIGGFNENYRKVTIEDEEFGERLTKEHKVFLNKSLQFDHMKHFTFFGLLKNDYKRGISWMKHFINKRKFKETIKTGRYLSANTSYMLNVPIISLFFLSLFLSFFENVFLYTTLVFFALFVVTNAEFHRFLRKERGRRFSLISTFITFIDMTAVIFGIVVGIGEYLGGNRLD